MLEFATLQSIGDPQLWTCVRIEVPTVDDRSSLAAQARPTPPNSDLLPNLRISVSCSSAVPFTTALRTRKFAYLKLYETSASVSAGLKGDRFYRNKMLPSLAWT